MRKYENLSQKECQEKLIALRNSTDYNGYNALKQFMKKQGWDTEITNQNGNGSTTEIARPIPTSFTPPTPPSPKPIRSEPTFPKDTAFSDTFSLYWHAYGDKSEVCPGYHFASAIAQVSQALGRKFILQGSVGTHYPNWYQCLIGTSYIASKSMIAEATSDAITEMFETNEDSCNRHKQCLSFASPEGLIDFFATHSEKGDELDFFDGQNGVRGFAWIDEMRSLFIKARQTSTEGLTPELTRLYKCPPRLTGQTRNNKTRAEKPFLNILGCTTLDWFEDSISISDISGGFVNRFVFYLHEQQPLFPLMDPIDRPTATAWQNALKDLEQKSLKETQIFDLDTKCLDVYKDWYVKTKTAIIDDPNSIEVIAGARVIEHTLKLALIFAVLDNAPGDNEIHQTAFQRAQDVATYWADVTKYMFSNLAVDKTDKLEKTILERLAEMNNTATWSELRKRLSGRTNTNEFNKAIETLVMAEQITVTDGRPKRIIRTDES